MAELERTSALAGHLRASGKRAGPRLGEVRPGAIAQVLGAPPPSTLRSCLDSYRLTDEPGPGRCARGDRLRVLWTGPDRYLVVSDQHADSALASALLEALQGHDCAVVDLSHARTVLRLEGPLVRDLLAKGCPLDLDQMRPGAAAATVLSHFNVLLHCDGEHAFELYAARSFGLSCFEWLCIAGREFDMSVA